MSVLGTKINNETTLYIPNNAHDSELIVLCTWLGASLKHIAKYIAIYQERNPSTPIILIESSILTITRPYPTQIRKMAESATLLQRILSTSRQIAEKPKILLHTFSNGGSNSAAQLLLAFHEKTGQKLPVQGIICDSGPAKGEYWKSYNSMTTSLPNSLPFTLVGPFIAHAVLLGMYSGAWMGRYPIFENLIRDTLISDDVVMAKEDFWFGEGVCKGEKRRIGYVWSKSDKQVDWRDVVEHGEDAKRRGWNVRSLEIEGSEHCGHLRVDEMAYKRFVEEMWRA